MADAGAAGGHQWKQIRVVIPAGGSNGTVTPGTVAFIAAELLSPTGAMSAGLSGAVMQTMSRRGRGGKILSGW
jgi:hypothetical protein